MRGPCAAVLQRVLLPEDDMEVRRRKVQTVPVALSLGTSVGARFEDVRLNHVGLAVGVVLCFGVAGYALVTQQLPLVS
eukprot:gene52898-9883_t